MPTKIKNYNWSKGYKYVDVPNYFKRLNFFGFTITIQSDKTHKKRVGSMVTKKEVWELYEDLLTPTIRSKKGSPGFTKLMYKGLPVIEREDMPKTHVGFIDRDKARVRLLNWKTGKHSKYMSFDEFEEWIKKSHKST